MDIISITLIYSRYLKLHVACIDSCPQGLGCTVAQICNLKFIEYKMQLQKQSSYLWILLSFMFSLVSSGEN